MRWTNTYKANLKILLKLLAITKVRRIGGDEFLAVLQHRDLKDCEKLFAQFDVECAKARIKGNGEKTISIARGFALFESDKDFCFNDVFKRADNAMYENKRKSKELQFEHGK